MKKITQRWLTGNFIKPVWQAKKTLLLLPFGLLLFIHPSLFAQEIGEIQNRWKGTYIQADGGRGSMGAQSEKSVWIIEKIAGSTDVRLKHRASGGYLNSETDARYPTVGGIQSGWLSAMWVLEPVSGTQYVRIKNKWRGTYLHTETGDIETGAIQSAWWSAQWEIKGNSASGGFNMILASDSQWPWTPKIDDNDYSESSEEKERVSNKLNTDHVISMNSLVTQLGNVKGVIINGDLTSFGHSGELAQFKSLYSALKVPMYNGLGNHDYANNVDDCHENNCANNMVEYMVDHIKNNGATNYDFKVSDSYVFPEAVTTITGSLAYSWDIGNIHFVQLHNYPVYERSWSNYVSVGAAKRKTVKITPSLNWLETDLSKARKSGKIIILNFHDSGQHWRDFTGTNFTTLSAQFTNILSKYKVGAVFVGHYHKNLGYFSPYSDRGVSYGDIPVYFCGSASQSNYLLVNFNGNKMTVENISSLHGAASRSDKREHTLFDQALDVTPPPADGYVTFFNEAGYVARYTLSYNMNGQPQSFSTGNMALGNKQRFEIPGNATNVNVKGEGQTGLLWEPWRVTFDKTFASPPNQCFKSFGTTLNQQWNNNCQ